MCGHLATEKLYIFCNSAVATPGFQFATAADLKDFWRADYYCALLRRALASGVRHRPPIALSDAMACILTAEP